ncbi:MAG TPA: hypothetical protein VMG09_15290 [Bacteroidota bacterium]|nr:hypothetical protein [Bacteroidota bacterium]
MTTKAPSSVRPADAASPESIAYSAVEGIPTLEPHDLDRLGYCVWIWLTTRRDSLEQAIKNANARLTISQEEATRRIRERLQQLGVSL